MKRASLRQNLLSVLLITLLPRLPAADNPVAIAIDPDADRTPISRFIYGTNQDLPGVLPTARRLGGNRTTGYNWENNASNAGADFFHQSDNFLTWIAGISDEEQPGIVVTDFHDTSLADGVPYSIITLPMAGYVARDKSGPVDAADAAPSSRWVEVHDKKAAAFALDPDPNDAFVYNDEMANFIVSTYGPASGATGIRGYSLDNEPDLWSSTHPRIHPAQPEAAELIARSTSLASAVKAVDPSAEVFGFVSYGFGGYYDFQAAPDWSTERAKGDYDWFLDYFLDRMQKASDDAGLRLLDVLDLHNYSEHIGGGERVNSPSTWENTACNLARMQAPRSFWDPTFDENSWIGDFFSEFLPFLPRIQASIDTFYPGTKLAFTEYNFGGESHISGGIAQADALGIFGRYGVYLATWWQLHDDPTYIAAAFNLYCNYDGAGGRFGDTAVGTTIADAVNCSAYASVDAADPDKLHVIVLNKSDTEAAAGAFAIAGSRAYTSGRVWAFDAADPGLTEREPIATIVDNTFSYTVPALTAAHIVLEAEDTLPVLAVQPVSAQAGTGARIVFSVLAHGAGPLTYQWRKDGADLTEETAAELVLPDIAADDAGTYQVVVSNAGGSTSSNAAVLTVDGGAHIAPSPSIVNLSTRGFVGVNDQVMIAGFYIGGSGAKKLLLRAVGPTLAGPPFSVGGTLPDPMVTLTTSAGTELAVNDDWGESQNVAAIADAMAATGAFAIPGDSNDAALLVALPPGGYTLIVRGADDTTGVAIAELYDADPDSAAHLVNISTRGPVGSGEAIMIPGFFVRGPGSGTLLIRAVGPTLANQPFNVSGAIRDPMLDFAPLGGDVIAGNDNWSDDGTEAAAIAAASAQVGAFALPNPGNDAAILHPVGPGGFTAPISGVDGATGVALAEVYLAP